ncbi:MAG: PAS domain-containing sensor histidine kinase [Pseudomonadota bacterium]
MNNSGSSQSGVDARVRDAEFAGGDGAQSPVMVDDAAMPFADTGSRAFRVGLAIVVLSLFSALATYLILTNLTPITPRGEVVFFVLFANVLLVGAVIAVVAWQGVRLYNAWRTKVAGARLHIRIVALFSLIAILPALLLAIAATTTFVRAIDGWFAERTRQIIENSLEVANAYVEEHGQVIRTDVVNMARDLNEAAHLLQSDPKRFRELVFVQAGLRDLPVAYIIDQTGKPLVTAIENPKIPYRAPPAELIKIAEGGQVPVLEPRDAYRVAAISRLKDHPGIYVFVARGVSPKVIRELRRTEAGVEEYTLLRKRRSGLQVAHGLLYFLISLTGMLAAIWAGLWFAGRFVAPIGRLIAAAQHISRGNLNVVLPIRRGEGDLRRLSSTFNTMTSELKSQRDELVSANQQLLERRRFTEAVLSGVSAGVIGLDSHGQIRLVNPSAETLLSQSADVLVGQSLDTALPDLSAYLTAIEQDAALARSPSPLTMVIDGEERTFGVRLTREATGTDRGKVVTLDDITELVAAQRTSAWADVARRIAHEIKNPLTPIQLSAERIRRKYGKVLTEDREVFDKCTDTIVRQVDAVARLVDDFSSFAKMRAPSFQAQDLRTVVREPVTLFQMSLETVDIALNLPDEPVVSAVDADHLGQVVTNLVKNAAEAIETAAQRGDRGADYRGRIEVDLTRTGDIAELQVADNGTGLDKQHRKRLLEPYVTTKKKGTGIGLAIVQQIIEQHGGTIMLEDVPPTEERPYGARVTVRLPIQEAGPVVETEDGLAAAE